MCGLEKVGTLGKTNRSGGRTFDSDTFVPWPGASGEKDEDSVGAARVLCVRIRDKRVYGSCASARSNASHVVPNTLCSLKVRDIMRETDYSAPSPEGSELVNCICFAHYLPLVLAWWLGTVLG